MKVKTPVVALREKWRAVQEKLATEPRCRVCGCSESRQCPGGCGRLPADTEAPKWAQSHLVCTKCWANNHTHLCLAIDPSISNFGWAVLQPIDDRPGKGKIIASNHWSPSGAAIAQHRFDQVVHLVTALILEFEPTDVVVEMPNPHHFPTTDGKRLRPVSGLMVYANTAGACAGCAIAHHRRTWRPNVKTWKDNASKGDTKLINQTLHKLDVKSEDENDAVGLTTWWVEHVHPCLVGRRPMSMLPAPAF